MGFREINIYIGDDTKLKTELVEELTMLYGGTTTIATNGTWEAVERVYSEQGYIIQVVTNEPLEGVYEAIDRIHKSVTSNEIAIMVTSKEVSYNMRTYLQYTPYSIWYVVEVIIQYIN